MPLAPSVFDIFATRAFLDELAEQRKAAGLQVGIVGMRVDSRTIAADQLQAFVKGLGLPVLGELRPTQNYVHLAARGLTLFDVAPGRVERDLEQWAGICRWLDSLTRTPSRRYSGRMRTIASLAELPALVGQEVAVSDWITVTQEQVNLFADATGDHQWIHVDVEQGQGRPVRRADRARLPHAVAAAEDSSRPRSRSAAPAWA